jgi:hypothetical protein
MRLSVEGQAAFAVAEEKDDEDWMEVAGRMQLAALSEVGLAPTAQNLALLRSAALAHPELALYVQHNRCRQGALRVGDKAPQLELYELNGCAAAFPPAEQRVHVTFAVGPTLTL